MATTEDGPIEASPRPLPRGWLALASAAHAAVFGWAATTLPYRSWTFFAVLTYALAVLHVATGALALTPRRWTRRRRWLGGAWRAQSVGSIVWLGYVGWGVLSSAWYVGGLYAGLGQGVAAALLAVFGLLVLVTLPIAAWGLASTGGLRLGRLGLGAVLLIAALGGTRLVELADEAAGTRRLDDDQVAGARRTIDDAVDVGALPPAEGRVGSLFTPAPARCGAPPEATPYTLIASYLVEPGEGGTEVETQCLQGPTPDAVSAALDEALKSRARRGPIKLDLIRRTGRLPPDDEPVTTLALRPGLDGVCGGSACLMPWQLVALSSFVEHAPLPSIPEARIGFSVDSIRRRLDHEHGPLTRVTTLSWLVTPALGSVAFGRNQSPEVELDAASVRAATLAAQQYILRAQHRDGRFNYIVDPFTGDLSMGSFSVARQAGTTLALCELGASNGSTRKVVRRSIDMLAALEHPTPKGDLALLATNPDAPAAIERAGPTALSLAALIRCRAHVGGAHDALAARLGRAILRLQRDDGSFHHHLDLEHGVPVPRMGGLYVDGQLILALVLLERLAAQGEPILPAADLHDPIDRAMSYFATEYWDIFLSDFLFIEENWHCLAAAEALDHHRHDAYERFCLDYVAMKSRTQLDAESRVHDDFVGGYGLGNLVPPHNTGTAGLGEAMAAALKIKKARGEDATELRERLQAAMTFLLRVQWHAGRCFACTKRRRIAGGFSEHMASPAIRIDYVQHAWAALGNGARALDLFEDGT